MLLSLDILYTNSLFYYVLIIHLHDFMDTLELVVLNMLFYDFAGNFFSSLQEEWKFRFFI